MTMMVFMKNGCENEDDDDNKDNQVIYGDGDNDMAINMYYTNDDDDVV